MTAATDRLLYEAAVRALRLAADELLAEGHSLESVALETVARRNALKQAFRAGMEPAILALIEARNMARYGDAVGPNPTMLLERYGNWHAVIDAACRPADLSRGPERRKINR